MLTCYHAIPPKAEGRENILTRLLSVFVSLKAFQSCEGELGGLINLSEEECCRGKLLSYIMLLDG